MTQQKTEPITLIIIQEKVYRNQTQVLPQRRQQNYAIKLYMAFPQSGCSFNFYPFSFCFILSSMVAQCKHYTTLLPLIYTRLLL